MCSVYRNAMESGVLLGPEGFLSTDLNENFTIFEHYLNVSISQF